MRKTALVIQRRLTHYRVPLFESLREELEGRGIRLEVAHGQATDRELIKNDEGRLPGAVVLRNRYVEIGGKTLCWQPLAGCLGSADLVVVTQESSLLSNYSLQLARLKRSRKLAYWGHGRNFQAAAPDGAAERWKRLWLKKVDWWFAYTQLTVDHLVNAGFPASRITCLDNAIDTQQFRRELTAVSEEDIAGLRTCYRIPSAAPIGVFCGSLYAEKRLDLLLSAADEVRRRLRTFHLIVIGDGPDRSWVTAQAEQRPWLHVMGALRGSAKAVCYAAASVVLNPGSVGLGVLDAFSAGAPLVTTRTAMHGPEIAYLRHALNGVLTADSVTDYSNAVIDLLTNKEERIRLGTRALADSTRYTVENMAQRFAEGIESALAGTSGPSR